MYDPLKLCSEEKKKDGNVQHIANPADVVPPTIARIKEVLATKWQVNLPAELIKMSDDDPSIAASGVVKEVAKLVADGKEITAAWVWFKRALALKVGKSISLHITRDESYKE